MPESKQRNVRVTYRRQVSDGNYGTEAAEVSLDWFIDDMVDTHADLDAAEEMLKQARDVVLGHLKTSLSMNVRRAVMPRREPAMASADTAATVPADDENTY